jgi:predicted regulator of Ras-like GTPase activity (Roadblock/LC7/MglB family)
VRNDLTSILSDVLTVRGVLAVALIDGSGAVRAEDALQPPGFAEAGPMVAAALAASRVLGGFVGGELRQTVIEYHGGPVVLAPLPGAAAGAGGEASNGSVTADDTMVVAVRLASLADLGRIRFHLPRLLARITAAV